MTEAYKLSQLRKYLGDVGLASADDGNWTAEIRPEKSTRPGQSKPRLEVYASSFSACGKQCHCSASIATSLTYLSGLCSVIFTILGIAKQEVCQMQQGEFSACRLNSLALLQQPQLKQQRKMPLDPATGLCKHRLQRKPGGLSVMQVHLQKLGSWTSLI